MLRFARAGYPSATLKKKKEKKKEKRKKEKISIPDFARLLHATPPRSDPDNFVPLGTLLKKYDEKRD